MVFKGSKDHDPYNLFFFMEKTPIGKGAKDYQKRATL